MLRSFEEGAQLNIYEPKVNKLQIESALNQKESEEIYEGKWIASDTVIKAVEDADAIVVITEWKEFRFLNWQHISRLMRRPSWLFDLCNITDTNEVKLKA